MKFTEPKEKIFSDSSEGPLQNPCRKFNRCYGSNADNKKAIIFIKLLKSGCPRTQSMRFSSKNVCKVDSTKVIDGPTNHRILKIKPGKHYTDDKGWFLDLPDYDLGKDYFQSTSDFLKKDSQEDLLKKHFIENENKIREDFKKKIKLLANYYKDLNDDYGFTNLTDNQLYKKVKAISERNKEKIQKGKHFTKMGNMKFYTIGEELYEDKSKANRFNILSELNIFPTAGNPYEQKLVVESEEDSESEQEKYNYNNPSTLLSLDEAKTSSSARKLFASSRKSRMQYINSKNLAEIEKLKRKSTTLYSLEFQTKYLSDLANIETLMESSHYSNLEMKLLNKKNSSPTIKKEKTPMIIESFGKVAHKLMEEEFNQSKYVTKAPNSNEQIKSPKINNFLPRPLNGPMAHKFKRASFLAEAICKEDLSDSLSFQYALKKIAHTHIQKLNINRVGSGDFVDTAVVEKMKKFRQKTQDEYFQRSDTAVSRNRKSRPIYNENLTNLTWKTKKEDKNPGFRTTRDIRPWKTTPHFRINTAN